MLDQALKVAASIDLTPALLLLAAVGACCSIYLMQLTHYESEDTVDPPWIRRIRRVALAGLAMTLCWTVDYSISHVWQPWPPFVFTLAFIDLLIGIMIFAIRARVRRTGPYLESQRHMDQAIRSKPPQPR